jgi:hypothetical protein
MAQIFQRLNRLIKSEINSSRSQIDIGQYQEITDFSVEEDNNFNVSNIPVSAANTLTGIGLYEAIKLIIEDDSSINSSYSFGVLALNRLISQGITLEEILDLAIEDMEKELAITREATISVMSVEKINIKKYQEARKELEKWEKRIMLAVQKDNDYLTEEALKRKKIFKCKVNNLQTALNEQIILSDCLKLNLLTLSTKVAEAKAFKTKRSIFRFTEVSNLKSIEFIDTDLEALKKQLDDL